MLTQLVRAVEAQLDDFDVPQLAIVWWALAKMDINPGETVCAQFFTRFAAALVDLTPQVRSHMYALAQECNGGITSQGCARSCNSMVTLSVGDVVHRAGAVQRRVGLCALGCPPARPARCRRGRGGTTPARVHAARRCQPRLGVCQAQSPAADSLPCRR